MGTRRISSLSIFNSEIPCVTEHFKSNFLDTHGDGSITSHNFWRKLMNLLKRNLKQWVKRVNFSKVRFKHCNYALTMRCKDDSSKSCNCNVNVYIKIGYFAAPPNPDTRTHQRPHQRLFTFTGYKNNASFAQALPPWCRIYRVRHRHEWRKEVILSQLGQDI